MVYKTDKLRARIIEKYGNQKNFAEAMKMKECTLSRYLAGRTWKGATMMKAIELLEIPLEEINSYFFEPAVAKSQP